MTVRALMVTLAAIPLVGASWFALGEVSRTSAARAQFAEVAHRSDDLVRVTQLRSSLLGERNWMTVTLGIDQIGVSTDLVIAVTGIDPDRELERARSLVDDLLVVDRDRGLVQLVDDVRTDPGQLADAGDRYLAIDQLLAARNDATLRELTRLAGGAEHGADVIVSLRALELASTAHHAIASQLTTYFAAQFSGPVDNAAALGLLIRQQARYDAAMAHLAEQAVAGSSTDAAFNAATASEHVAEFQSGIGQLIETGLLDGATQMELSASTVLSDIDNVAAMFEAGAHAADIHLALVGAAGDEVADASRSVADDAAAAALRATLMLSALTAISLGFAVVLTRSVVIPLHILVARVRALRDGHPRPTGKTRGPSEIREIAAVIDEAAAQLVLAERQARALAEGDINHPSLREPAPGQLGAALQDSVHTLATSLDEHEQFRVQLAHEAATDHLTALPNRNAILAALNGSLARVRRNGTNLAVMFIDLDGFKEINDHHGHRVGDAALRSVADRLTASLRDGDHVGRLGGDEFLVIAEPVAGVDDALTLAHRIANRVAEPICTGDTWFRLDASIGVALADNDPPLTADELLHDADLAVYKAKQTGRGQIEVCNLALKEEALHNTRFEHALKHAISHDELSLHYQPIIDPRDGSTQAIEALLRWERDGRDDVPPSEMIGFAERTDLIVDIDNWVLDRVADQIRRWDRSGRMQQIAVTVNISARHFARPDLTHNILTPLERHRVDPARIVIELTESALLGDLDEVASKLRELRARGVRIALDDFGTGYASLAYLRRLPVDIVKIDRSYITDGSAAPFVKLIIDIAHHIGATVTAEGVETTDQMQRLMDLGCDLIQGFLYAHPQPPDDLDTDGRTPRLRTSAGSNHSRCATRDP